MTEKFKMELFKMMTDASNTRLDKIAKLYNKFKKPSDKKVREYTAEEIGVQKVLGRVFDEFDLWKQWDVFSTSGSLHDLVIRCFSEEEANVLLHMVENLGFTWSRGYGLSETNRYSEYEDKTCYHLIVKSSIKCVLYCNENYYLEKGYKVINFNQFIREYGAKLTISLKKA